MAAPAIIPGTPSNGIRIEKVEMAFEDFKYRTPYKFGGTAVDRVTLLNVTVEVSNAAGKTAKGFGSMPMGNVWSFPSTAMSYETTLNAMRELAKRIAKITGEFKGTTHPIEINHTLEPEYLKAAADVSRDLALATPVPKLCTQVTASPFDAALHDAFGKILGLNCYQTYSRELMGYDLPRYLNADFKGESLASYVSPTPRDWVWLFHSVGGLDPVTPDELKERVNDGLPETLGEWIKRDGLQRIKIKLQGENLEWDIARTVAIDRVARETRPDVEWKYCCDFNEHCPNVDYLLEYLRKVKEQAPQGFESILYLEQPTKRDLRADRGNVMHEAAKLRPVVIDESLTDLENLMLSREMGYTGACLKACKGQSHAMLMAAAGKKYDMFLCVQDLTCPGASLIHSAGIASHIPGLSTIESNAREYVPSANAAWTAKFPGLFDTRDGKLATKQLTGPGLGAVA
ncbi:mandelate racemase/muconate lactonizing enzyme family protein [Luteolibacter ambystomatis]|uniref:Mandelate racemase/muconate lactonizing enzyme family protein n=1 Tax=Luteolibacter ambystomatis TaxID=2824561 RepID=A0A975G966_9BACT|nr:mandelate racemase/muconate lactonizing enzyme family protein [Luteolibacter ambystomatis]QUE51288.1 mandelate racemase/muconate lactonizing enzyme family protein [Luteolibacter ambystomatis]